MVNIFLFTLLRVVLQKRETDKMKKKGRGERLSVVGVAAHLVALVVAVAHVLELLFLLLWVLLLQRALSFFVEGSEGNYVRVGGSIGGRHVLGLVFSSNVCSVAVRRASATALLVSLYETYDSDNCEA